MKKIKPLISGSLVRLIAPSSPFEKEKLEKGVGIFKAMGLKVIYSDQIFGSQGYLAGDDRSRLLDFLDAFTNPEYDAVIPVRGGYGSMRILPHLVRYVQDLHPKLFCGFSDITALHMFFMNIYGMHTIHGTNAIFATRLDEESLEKTKNALFGISLEQTFTYKGLVPLVGGRGFGKLVVGNLSLFAHLIGTPFAPPIKGSILVMEDVSEPLYRIDRMLTMLSMQEDIKEAIGFAFGDMGVATEEMSALEYVLRRFAETIGKPAVMGFPIGHVEKNHPVPQGVIAEIDADLGILKVIEDPYNRKEDVKVSFSFNPDFREVRFILKSGVGTVYPGAVLLVGDENDILLFEAVGRTGYPDLDPMSEEISTDTIFDLASLAKPLSVASLLMLFVQEGKVHLETEVGKYLPVNKDLGSCTIAALLSHTAGLAAWRPYAYNIIDRFGLSAGGSENARSEVISLLYQERPEIKHGCVYSDLGFMILSLLIEEVSGMTFDDAFHKMIAEPLGLKYTFFVRIRDGKVVSHPVEKRRFASTEICPIRGRLMKGEVHDENAWILGGISGHAGLFSTAKDCHKIISNMLSAYKGNHTGMFAPSVVRRFWSFEFTPLSSTRVLGFDTPCVVGSSAGTRPPRRAVGHLGFTGTSIWTDLSKGIIVVLLTNRVHPTRANQKIKDFRPKIHDAIWEETKVERYF